MVGKRFDFDGEFWFADGSDSSKGCSTLLSLVKEFDSVLAVYDGFCKLKQVWMIKV